MSARDTTARPRCVFGASVGFPSWINRLDRIGRYHWPKLKRKQLNGTNKTISLLEFDAAARPRCVIGVSVWASALEKSACPNSVVGTYRGSFSRTAPHKT